VWENPPHFGNSDGMNEQAQSLQRTFGLRFTPAAEPQASMYIRYHWPVNTLVRTFGSVARVECLPEQAIAHHDRHPIAIKRSIGHGGIVFLGSMLGPHLAANDREAQGLAKRIVTALSSPELHSDTLRFRSNPGISPSNA